MDFYDQVKRLTIKIENLSSNKLYNKYTELTKDLLDEYRQILTVPVKSSFTSKIIHKDKDQSRKKIIQQTFIDIAKNFADTQYELYQEEEEEKYSCDCGNCNDFEISEGLMICDKCGLETPMKTVQSNFKDVDRIHLSNKYRYEKRSHFREAILQFQGKQVVRINPSLYEQAEKWLDIHGLINKEGKTRQEKFSKVKKEHIRMFISESADSEISANYENLKLIHSNLTDKPCPDISHLEEKMMVQFDRLVDSFLSFADVERTNFLNCQFVLKELLLYNNYKIDPDDFQV